MYCSRVVVDGTQLLGHGVSGQLATVHIDGSAAGLTFGDD